MSVLKKPPFRHLMHLILFFSPKRQLTTFVAGLQVEISSLSNKEFDSQANAHLIYCT